MSITKEELDRYIHAYSIGNPLISDEEYDRLLEEYLKEHGGESARPFLRQSQSASVNDIVGTLPKTYGVRVPMRPGQKTYKDLVESRSWIGDICLQPKFDGCSVALDCATNRFFTRGDYDDGTSVDVTDLFVQQIESIKRIVIPGTTAMKFEAIISHEIFYGSDLHTIYKRPRDVVAAAITSRQPELAKYISLIPLRGYINGKQYIPKSLCDSGTCLFTICADYSGIESFINARLEDGATVKIFDQTYSIDGVVPSLCDISHDVVYTRPDQEIAIKILYNVQETKLKSIEYQFGKQGRITPVAILEPVKFDTVTVDHVTLSTLQRVVDMQLRHDDTVRIMYNIVPYFLESYHDGDYPIPIPQKCPICGAKLDYLSYRLVRCSNPECKGLRLGAIIRHAEKMKMVGLGKGVITRLYDEGFVQKIEDLYHLRDWDESIQRLDGFGSQSFHNMLESVSKALSDATLPRFLGALPFNDTDEKTWKQILSYINEQQLVESMINGSFPEFIMTIGYIPTVGTLKLQRIIDGYLKNQDDIKSMLSWIPSKLKQTNYQAARNGKICMTGTRDADLTQALVESGYEVGGWSNDCIAVVVPDENFVSAKTEKAKAKGIPIYDIKGAYEFLVKPF